MLYGTDISAYQASTVPSGDFTIIKATEGLTYTSSKFRAQWADAADKKQLRGAYHFGHPDNDPADEADHFLSVVRPVLSSGDLLVLDHEVSDGTSAAHCASWARAWLAWVETAMGLRPVVYTFLSFAREGRCDGLGGYPLWIADPSRAAGNPRVPAPWTSWVLHQYAETGGIDRDVFDGTPADWRALASGNTPLEDDMYGGQIPAGKGQQVNISFPRGRLSALGLVIDNDVAVPGVIDPQPPAEIRVAVHRYTGAWQLEQVKVGRAPGDDKTVKTVIHFDSHENVDFVSMVRIDDGNTPVGWDMS